MLNDNAKKWVAALRSGEFKQTNSALRNKGAYCCLGVACELYRRESRGAKWRDDTFFVSTGGVEESRATDLPAAVMDWLGFNHEMGGYAMKSSLAEDNDSGKTFSQIADIIEAEPKGLFKK